MTIDATDPHPMTDLDWTELLVIDQPERSRYELVLEGRPVGVIDYDVEGGAMNLSHTEVDPAWRGRGFGDALVRGALENVRRRGLRVRARCSFVQMFFDTHPRYRDLLSLD